MSLRHDKLAAWYARHARDLPWRRNPEPYETWVSEIMLQQTRVEAVREKYEHFMRRFPNVKLLAATRLEDVLQAWSGLGYYRRARMLHAAAKQIAKGGFPDTVAGLRVLPGIGRYTAGAIASIALGQRVPIVDGNIERVFSRWHGITRDIKSAAAQRQLWKLADEWVAHEAYPPATLNQALMELGALVCTPKAPGCGRCPVAKHCFAAQHGDPESLPRLAARKPARDVQYLAVAATDPGGYILMVRRPEDDNSSLLPGGLWELPHAARTTDDVALAGKIARQHGVRLAQATANAGKVRHSIMDARVTITLTAAGVKRTKVNTSQRWFTPAEAEAAAASSATRKLLALWRGVARDLPVAKMRAGTIPKESI